MSAAYASPTPEAPATFERAHAHGAEVERTLRGQKMLRAEHAEVETFIEKQGREWGRLMVRVGTDDRSNGGTAGDGRLERRRQVARAARATRLGRGGGATRRRW